jgi:hypothetical protein
VFQSTPTPKNSCPSVGIVRSLEVLGDELGLVTIAYPDLLMHLQRINDLMSNLDRISIEKSPGRSLPHNPLGSNGGLGVVSATPMVNGGLHIPFYFFFF